MVMVAGERDSGLYHNPLFDHIRGYFERADPESTLFIFVPYVKTKVLEKLVGGLVNRIVVVITWEPKDIQFGSSELALYPFCRDHGIALYVSQKMHLKVYSAGLSSAILSTGNVSNSGLLPGGNYEVATMLEDLTVEDRLYFEGILREARLVDDALYEELKAWADENTTDLPKPPTLNDVVSALNKNNFLTSALPMTPDIDDLVSGYRRISAGHEPSDDPETAACIFHDLANYGIAPGLDPDAFLPALTEAFFSHPFIQKIDRFIAPEAYFGRIKEWIQNNCTDVPVPSRRELTGNVQVLLEWFVALGNGVYEVDVPGARSQRIKKVG